MEKIDRIPEQSFKEHGVTELNEVTECDYYNQIPGKAPSAGGMQELRDAREADQQDGSINRVRN